MGGKERKWHLDRVEVSASSGDDSQPVAVFRHRGWVQMGEEVEGTRLELKKELPEVGVGLVAWVASWLGFSLLGMLDLIGLE